MRSATAHKIYEHDQRFQIKSAGTDKAANTVLDLNILNWADSIVVMEKYHRNFIRQKFPEIYTSKKIVCLYIPDDYEFMQAELIETLKNKFEDAYRKRLINTKKNGCTLFFFVFFLLMRIRGLKSPLGLKFL